jgi:hypothetical protein
MLIKNWSAVLTFFPKSTRRTSHLIQKSKTQDLTLCNQKRLKTSYSNNKESRKQSSQSKYSRILNNMNNEEEKHNDDKGLAKIESREDKQAGDEEDAGGMSISSFYSLDKPKDAFSGSSQGVGNILKGMLLMLCHATPQVLLRFYGHVCTSCLLLSCDSTS